MNLRDKRIKELSGELPKLLRSYGDGFHTLARYLEQGDEKLAVKSLAVKMQEMVRIYSSAVELDVLLDLRQKDSEKRRTQKVATKRGKRGKD